MPFSYQDALDALAAALKFGIDPSLEPIGKLCDELASPQNSFTCVQVAGTNGKSSTTRIIAALLRGEGYRTGLYTSPELVEYPERMEIDGAVVSHEDFARGIEAALEAGKRAGIAPTEFELLTAAALWLFAQEGVEYAVLECGLGGRWDATSICTPKVSVITGVGLDHTAILGDTLEQIAAEKAAIIREGGTCVMAHDVACADLFERRAAALDVEVVTAAEVPPAYIESALEHMPSYQKSNAATALAAAAALLGCSPDRKAAQDALSSLIIPGRFETLRNTPLLIIDAAHNPQSAAVLAQEVAARFGSHSPVLLLGILADKDARGIVEALAPAFDRIVVSASASPRALPAEKLTELVSSVTGNVPKSYPDLASALVALATEDVLATGSITVAGEVKRLEAYPRS